jgi:hypothetical protein
MRSSSRSAHDEPPSGPLRRRWWHWFTWLQFSTRSLLLLVILASFGSLYLRHTLKASRQREALARLAKTASVTSAEREGVVIEVRLRFPGQTTLFASDFDGLDLLSDLERLIVEVDQLSPGALEPIRNCHRLFELELVGELPDQTLSHLPKNLQVSSFAINRTSSDSPKEAIRTVTRWPGLRRFTLQGIGDDATFLDVASPENSIRELCLVGGLPSSQSKKLSGLEEVFLHQLPGWKSLRSLELLRLKLRGTVDGPSLAKLDRLSVAHCDAGETTLEGLVALPELKFVRLWNCTAKPQQISTALAGPKLTELELLSLDANGTALSGLSNTKSLESLTVSLNLADEAMLRSLEASPSIKEVDLVNLAGERTLPNLKRVRHVEAEIDRIVQQRQGKNKL